MPSIINTNLVSLNAQRNLNRTDSELSTALQRISSGLRINSAKDDAAGLAISERFTSQIRSFNQAARNANDGISLAQTTEGALAEVNNNLQRLRELAIQSANATNSANDRAALDSEAQQLIAEIDRVAQQTQFNGTKVLDGTFVSQAFQIGANANQTISVSSVNARTATLGAFASVATATDNNQRSLAVNGAGGAAIGDANQLETDELTVNGAAIGAPIADGVSFNPTGLATLSSQSAIAIANAVNLAAAGVTATADANVVNLGTVTGGTLGSNAFTINGVSIAGTFAGGASTDIVTAINTVENQTGVTAALNASNQLVLTAADGRNIALAQNTDAAAASDVFTSASSAGNVVSLVLAVDVVFDSANATASQTVIRSTVSLTSGGAITIGDGVAGGNASEIGFSTGSTAVSTATALQSVQLTTAALSQSAIATIDVALNSVSSSRATFGAIQNRLESTIRNIQTIAENLSAARSRVQDADFAAETAALTRAQILQQAGISILAQANAQPQNVLALLQ